MIPTLKIGKIKDRSLITLSYSTFRMWEFGLSTSCSTEVPFNFSISLFRLVASLSILAYDYDYQFDEEDDD